MIFQDLHRFVQSYVSAFESPLHRIARPALPGPEADGYHRTPEAWSEISIRPHLRNILAAATSVSINPDIDPDEVFDLVLGIALVHSMVPLS